MPRSSSDAREACRVVDPRLLPLADLPADVAGDANLLRHLWVRYGPAIDQLRLRLLAVRLMALEDHRLSDFDEHFEGLIEEDREYDAIMLRCGEEPDWPWHAAEDRRLIARCYLDAFATEQPVRPVMLDLLPYANQGFIDVIDGHHRIQAAHEAGASELLAYETQRCLVDR